MNRERTVILLEIAMMAAFAMVLDFIDSQIKGIFFGLSRLLDGTRIITVIQKRC